MVFGLELFLDAIYAKTLQAKKKRYRSAGMLTKRGIPAMLRCGSTVKGMFLKRSDAGRNLSVLGGLFSSVNALLPRQFAPWLYRPAVTANTLRVWQHSTERDLRAPRLQA
jgi:hypothetical protein